MSDSYLKVYKNRSVLVDEDGLETVFLEGRMSSKAQTRYEKIISSLESGYFTTMIERAAVFDLTTLELEAEHVKIISEMVESVTSERGRAIVGLAVLQLCIKAIEPSQSIRLHKGSARGRSFSWKEGLPMRVIDSRYITPTLRTQNLLRVNRDGIMMTRSFAENYPYSHLYKALIRGARQQWMQLVEFLEAGHLNPEQGLIYILAKLIDRRENIEELSNNCVTLAKTFAAKANSEQVVHLLMAHLNNSTQSARLFEVLVHSFNQVIEDRKLLPGRLKPLTQMRSANLKHGNVGDIEIISHLDERVVLEAWDTKYGITYLLNELTELQDKLTRNSSVSLVGFITNEPPDMRSEVIQEMRELEEEHDVEVEVLDLESYLNECEERFGVPIESLTSDWLVAYAESLGQKRRDRAPIDEPVAAWLTSLIELLT